MPSSLERQVKPVKRGTNHLFFAQMGFSSALALLRGFVVAQILTMSSFGIYAVIVASGTFAASFISFGWIERTNKRFPRLFEDGHPEEALREADSIARLLARRALFAGPIAAVGALFFGHAELVMPIICASGIALTVGWQGIYASVHRAGAELDTLAHATLARTVMALVFAGIGGYVASWQGAVIGELIASTAGARISRFYARRLKGSAPPATEPPHAADKDLWLFAAFMVGSMPIYLDRLVVSTTYGSESAGRYSVLMLFVTAASTVATIALQKLGPQLVRLERGGASFNSQMRLLFGWAAGLGGLIAIGMIFAAFLLLASPLSFLAIKYRLDAGLLMATTVLCVAQLSMMLDWILLSHDKERYAFFAAAGYVLVLAISLWTVIHRGGDLVAFIWAMAAAKLIHGVLQGALILILPAGFSKRGSAPPDIN